MSKNTIISPRAARYALGDVGERSALIRRQRVGRVSRRSRRRGGGRRLLLALVVLIVLGLQAAVVAWLLTTPRFAVGTVEVRGASRVPAERIRAAAAIAPGTNLWRIDPTAVVSRIEALPQIRRAELIRELPDRVAIVVEERRPFTLVHGGRLHWLDEEGQVLGVETRAVASPAPVIVGLGEEELARMRTTPSARARNAIALIRVLLRSGSPLAAEISEIDVSRREGPVLYTMDGIEVRLGAEDWGERLARLEGVLTQVARQAPAVTGIDLRFRDQVILTRGGQG